MIDYEKLIRIYKIAYEYALKNDIRLELTQLMVIGAINDSCSFKLQLNGNDFYFYSSDDLITKLTEPTAPKPKYKIGDEVWYMDFSKIISCSVIKKIDLFDQGYRYIIEEAISAPECNLYSTKQALIESQNEDTKWRMI